MSNQPNRCSECDGRGWTTSDYDIPALRDTCERCDGSGAEPPKVEPLWRIKHTVDTDKLR